jgi:hypothetical protein
VAERSRGTVGWPACAERCLTTWWCSMNAISDDCFETMLPTIRMTARTSGWASRRRRGGSHECRELSGARSWRFLDSAGCTIDTSSKRNGCEDEYWQGTADRCSNHSRI